MASFAVRWMISDSVFVSPGNSPVSKHNRMQFQIQSQSKGVLLSSLFPSRHFLSLKLLNNILATLYLKLFRIYEYYLLLRSSLCLARAPFFKNNSSNIIGCYGTTLQHTVKGLLVIGTRFCAVRHVSCLSHAPLRVVPLSSAAGLPLLLDTKTIIRPSLASEIASFLLFLFPAVMGNEPSKKVFGGKRSTGNFRCSLFAIVS